MTWSKSLGRCGVKVYMVHRESGEYSDWTYEVLGMFSSYANARRYLRGIEVPLAKESYDPCFYLAYSDDATVAHATLKTTDGKHFTFHVPNRRTPISTFGCRELGDHYITEFELDGSTDG